MRSDYLLDKINDKKSHSFVVNPKVFAVFLTCVFPQLASVEFLFKCPVLFPSVEPHLPSLAEYFASLLRRLVVGNSSSMVRSITITFVSSLS